MSTLVLFSHPNHELAIFGLLQRRQPSLVYLTDGGGPERIEQTQRGLAAIGVLERAIFLNHREQRLYDALLDGDLAFYQGLARQVRKIIDDRQPAELLCDAVEFYNPVHDVSLPVAWAAVAERPIALFEVPLIHQRPADRETYEVQRPRASKRDGQIELHLSDRELAAKLHARDQIYSSLANQLGPVMRDLPVSHLQLEVITPATTPLPEPDASIVLRYEWRAAMLKARNEIARQITYAIHYLPIAASLAGQPSGASSGEAGLR
jgi:hypothetical protein